MRLFRVAVPATATRNVVKTAAQVVVVWTFALALLPALTVAVEHRFDVPRWSWPPRAALGWTMFAAGSALGLASAWVMATRGRGTPVPFDAARELVVVGPYRVLRNPMAVGAIVQLLGIGGALGSGGCALLAVAAGVLWHAVIRPTEERFLVDRFGQPYEHYRAAVRCWIPTWPPYSA